MVQIEEKTGEIMVRTPICVTLPKKCVDWLNEKVESRIYANRSHGVELLILKAIEKEKSPN